MNKLVQIEKRCKKSENALKKLFNEVAEKAKLYNVKSGVDYEFWFGTSQYETDDLHGGEKKISRDGHCVWLSNVWVNSNVVPEGIEVIDGRYPVRVVSYWYTPYCYNTMLNRDTGMRFTPEELYKRSETEKVLYTDSDIKVSMVRRNVIPFFKSCQYSHKISHHEYVMYLRRFCPSKRIQKRISDINEQMDIIRQRFNNGEITREEFGAIIRDYCAEKRKLHSKGEVWHEVAHDKKLKDLFITARRYFNDWCE